MVGGSEETRKRLLEKLRRELGPLVLDAMANPRVMEILLNPDGQLWCDVHGEGLVSLGQMEPIQSQNAIGTVASMLGTEVNRLHPILEGELPLDGSRFEGILPPLVEGPCFSIRKRALVVYTLKDYCSSGVIDELQRTILEDAVRERQNILVVGATSSGKTTFCNALLQCVADVDPSSRIVIIEDTRELQCPVVNQVALRTSENVTMGALLRATLRMRPDRIVVGEVRGAEALSLIKSWGTGHPGGVATIHANNARAGLNRIEQMIQEANVPPIKSLIASAVNVIISIQKTKEGRRVQEIVRVVGFDGHEYIVEQI